MRTSKHKASDAELARDYFGSFSDDYQHAFEGRGRHPLHAVINRLFRRKTFQLRTAVVKTYLADLGVAGKTIADVGCGTGEVSIEAARLGATRVLGLDIAPAMVHVAVGAAEAAGVSAIASFQVQDVLKDPCPPCDIAMMVGVIEYYQDLDALFAAVAPAAREALIIVDTRGPWWRRTLRYGLAKAKRFHLYYRSPDAVGAIVRRHGFVEDRRHLGHSFSALRFRRHA